MLLKSSLSLTFMVYSVVIYASCIKGKAGLSPDNLADDIGPLFEAILRCIPEPNVDKDGALQMLAST